MSITRIPLFRSLSPLFNPFVLSVSIHFISASFLFVVVSDLLFIYSPIRCLCFLLYCVLVSEDLRWQMLVMSSLSRPFVDTFGCDPLYTKPRRRCTAI